ncbi:MAG: M15 family metallopeptidase [Ruminococcus sp.]|nr:M15 family metallopeptidase [Ruminococcus sp.]
MSNGSQRSSRRQKPAKKYRLRVDRVVAAALVLIVLIVIFTSCAKSCSKGSKSSSDDGDASTSEPTTQSSIVDNLDTSGQSDTLLTSQLDTLRPDASQFVNEPHPSTDIYRGNLVLINSAHEYTFPSDDTDPAEVWNNRSNEFYNVSDYVIKLDKETLASLDAWMAGFYADKKSTEITIIGGYRTKNEQEIKYNGGYTRFKGGFSDYHSARTFDMGIFPKDGSSSGYYTSTGIYSWLDENAAEYGFIVRFPEGKEELTGEPARTYTYRYVGKPHATYIKQNGLCLEEYIEKIKSYNSTAPLEITVGQKLYQVYYVPAAASGNTDVPVPQDKTHSVSGNNCDGFIVTVALN